MRRVLTGVAVALALVALGGAWLVATSPLRDEPVPTDRVRVTDDAFEPAVIVVPVGTSTTWTFAGEDLHDVTLDGWTSGPMASGTVSRTFDRPGVLDYRCSLHPLTMRGRVVVG